MQRKTLLRSKSGSPIGPLPLSPEHLILEDPDVKNVTTTEEGASALSVVPTTTTAGEEVSAPRFSEPFVVSLLKQGNLSPMKEKELVAMLSTCRTLVEQQLVIKKQKQQKTAVEGNNNITSSSTRRPTASSSVIIPGILSFLRTFPWNRKFFEAAAAIPPPQSLSQQPPRHYYMYSFQKISLLFEQTLSMVLEITSSLSSHVLAAVLRPFTLTYHEVRLNISMMLTILLKLVQLHPAQAEKLVTECLSFYFPKPRSPFTALHEGYAELLMQFASEVPFRLSPLVKESRTPSTPTFASPSRLQTPVNNTKNKLGGATTPQSLVAVRRCGQNNPISPSAMRLGMMVSPRSPNLSSPLKFPSSAPPSSQSSTCLPQETLHLLGVQLMDMEVHRGQHQHKEEREEHQGADGDFDAESEEENFSVILQSKTLHPLFNPSFPDAHSSQNERQLLHLRTLQHLSNVEKNLTCCCRTVFMQVCRWIIEAQEKEEEEEMQGGEQHNEVEDHGDEEKRVHLTNHFYDQQPAKKLPHHKPGSVAVLSSSSRVWKGKKEEDGTSSKMERNDREALWWTTLLQKHYLLYITKLEHPFAAHILAPALFSMVVNQLHDHEPITNLLHKVVSLVLKDASSSSSTQTATTSASASKRTMISMGPQTGGANLSVEERCRIARHLYPLFHLVQTVVPDEVREGIIRRLGKWLRQQLVRLPPTSGPVSTLPLSAVELRTPSGKHEAGIESDKLQQQNATTPRAFSTSPSPHPFPTSASLRSTAATFTSVFSPPGSQAAPNSLLLALIARGYMQIYALEHPIEEGAVEKSEVATIEEAEVKEEEKEEAEVKEEEKEADEEADEEGEEESFGTAVVGGKRPKRNQQQDLMAADKDIHRHHREAAGQSDSNKTTPHHAPWSPSSLSVVKPTSTTVVVEEMQRQQEEGERKRIGTLPHDKVVFRVTEDVSEELLPLLEKCVKTEEGEQYSSTSFISYHRSHLGLR